MVDPERDVLWACAVDLSFQTASELRAFDLHTGALEASYIMPEGGVCADIALARGDVYVTDTGGGRIVRLTEPIVAARRRNPRRVVRRSAARRRGPP